MCPSKPGADTHQKNPASAWQNRKSDRPIELTRCFSIAEGGTIRGQGGSLADLSFRRGGADYVVNRAPSKRLQTYDFATYPPASDINDPESFYRETS
ncbi:hypothetical protein Rhsp01_13800 [Rhizobium sp. NBRC 114257]|uniref:Uncharacterized protein n=1 Tax=Rhizobium dioscoreae TaxID=2653122 RepID=A0ABQ0YZS0_9HYPH|nr:hypothetical protein RsS93_13750 [Rhizobium dioscoreae]GLU80204.1 hypothetical protein Rhsp01_13800 [Rhizobium sp. NBRC 114257]